MRLTTKKLEEIMVTILGEDGLPLVHELSGKENVSEFDLAKKIKKDIKIVRKMLYILYNNNLVSFTRKKDKQKGWYIYYWTLINESIRFNYFKMKRDLLERLQQQLETEERELFFICPNDCVRLDFDQAMDFEFHCPECGELITQDDKEKRIQQLKSKIVKVSEELEKLKEQRKVRRQVVKEKKKEVKKRAKTATKAKAKTTTKKKVVKKPAKKATKKTTAKPKKEKKVKKTAKKLADKKKAVKKVAKKKATTKKKAATKKVTKKKTVKKSVKKKGKK